MNSIKHPLINEDIYKKENHLNDFQNIPSILLYDNTPININPLISITIPAYKRDLLWKAISSAIKQKTDIPYEIIIIDDNENEDTKEVISFLENYNCNKIRYYKNQKNIGLFGNWNRCIQLARGEYIVYLHGDDFLNETTIESLWDVHTKVSSKAAIIGRYASVDENNTVKYCYIKKRSLLKSLPYYKISNYGLLQGDLCNGCGSLLNVDCLKEIGGWNPRLYPLSDRALFLQYAELYGLYRVNEVVRYETSFMSESAKVYQQYPACDYILTKAVIYKYYKKYRIFFNWINKHKYIMFSNTKTVWDVENSYKYKKCRISRFITRIFRLSYYLADKTII